VTLLDSRWITAIYSQGAGRHANAEDVRLVCALSGLLPNINYQGAAPRNSISSALLVTLKRIIPFKNLTRWDFPQPAERLGLQAHRQSADGLLCAGVLEARSRVRSDLVNCYYYTKGKNRHEEIFTSPNGSDFSRL